MNKVSANYLVQAWRQRYAPDFSTLSLGKKPLNYYQLIEMTSRQGREKTVKEIQRLIDFKCDYAEMQSNILFSYIPNVVKLSDSWQLATYIKLAYDKALSIYQQQQPISLPPSLSTVEKKLLENIDVTSDLFKQKLMPTLILPTVEILSRELQPILLQLRKQYKSANDQRLIGFVSTQFHFSTAFVLNQVRLSEQLLVSPYFKFVEEQVCIPWQRVCAAAVKYAPNSAPLAIVQQLLPASREIAFRVHQKANQIYPTHRSRRGKLDHPGVKASSLRDIEMFQAYLWLCFLEDSMTAVQEELLPLCAMVFPTIDVKWELVEQIPLLLVNEFQSRLTLQQMNMLQPYTQAMQDLFSQAELKAN
ncbi:MAG: hypothetical protein WA919_09940 [Coleofasciculaceae cyanobacterium]